MTARADRSRRLRGLYAITPETADTEGLVRRVSAILEGGAAIVQYRRKAGDDALAIDQALRVGALCRKSGALFLVNDSPDLARAAGADGVHLGRDDADVASARAIVGDAIVGVSCYAEPERARDAARAGADYVAIGSVFASPTKPGAVAAPLGRLSEAARLSGLPVAAIGGITPGNAALALEAGADMLAVISALFEAPDPGAAARAFRNLFLNSSHADLHVRRQPAPL